MVNYMIQNFSTAYTTTFAVFMNKNKWDSLTQTQQDTIQAINAEFALKHGQAWDKADELGMEFFKEKKEKSSPSRMRKQKNGQTRQSSSLMSTSKASQKKELMDRPS